MSWEETSRKEVKCPCKKGKIALIAYMDDWNRTKESVNIVCLECKRKYEIITKAHNRLMPSDGSWEEYFLIDKNYPKSEYEYSSIINVPSDAPYYVCLIRGYTKNDLLDILSEYESITRVKDLRGVYSRVAKDSKSRTGSAVRENIIADLKKALELYDSDPDNFEIHQIAEKERKTKHDEYLKERDKHLIKLDF